MVNNSTKINKAKESLNCDGQQFYQNPQNVIPRHMSLKIHVLAWDRYKDVMGTDCINNHSFDSPF